ncbi:MAG TPA: patatin-like phospholipase family protein [Polyangiaceae bacterium]|nr:patatin-like phospholipase family protein [Polyangiaceae bacterium]
MGNTPRARVAVACQGGGSHTSFTAGVLQGLLSDMPSDVEIVALSGTSGGAICAALAWDGLVRHEPQRGVAGLRNFWTNMAATDFWDQLLNHALISMMSLRDRMALPEISPYHLPTWGEERFRSMLEDAFDFAQLRELARQPGAPGLQIGAVEVLSGHFDLFTGEELCAECLLASAAIPDLFRAVNVPGRGVYWDGLFSQNPPIHDLVRYEIDELWVIQINSRTCARVPTEPHEIMDRRNALSGNLSLMQELKFIEMINRAIADGSLTNPRYRPIQVERIALDRDLGYRSKIDRGREKLEQLRAYGQAKWRWFAQEREARRRFPRSDRAVARDSGIQELLAGAGQV